MYKYSPLSLADIFLTLHLTKQTYTKGISIKRFFIYQVFIDIWDLALGGIGSEIVFMGVNEKQHIFINLMIFIL